jgi:hypothetical protein
MRNLTLPLFTLLFLGFCLAGCKSVQEETLPPQSVEASCTLFYIDKNGVRHDMQPLDISMPTDEMEERDNLTGTGCGDDTRVASESNSLVCCYINNLREYDQVNFPNSVVADLGRANAFEGTSYIYRGRLWKNGVLYTEGIFTDPWIGSRCNDIIYNEYGFSTTLSPWDSGICCNDVITVEIARFYIVNYGTKWNLCCKKQISFPFRGPRWGPPCC